MYEENGCAEKMKKERSECVIERNGMKNWLHEKSI
jgi:hypothetical protein